LGSKFNTDEFMKYIKRFFSVLLVAAFAGCATQSGTVVNEPVGPDLARPKINLSQGRGQLVVYSALETVSPVSSDFPTHTGYDIYDGDGKLAQRVDNRSGSFYQTPATVRLAPGQYQVKARATNHGLVTVPVIVKEDQTTVLDLDGTYFWQHKPTGAGQWVRLSSGEVIGMRVP
jgi:hypothetical protein